MVPATGTATSNGGGKDYNKINKGALTFAPGQTSQTITVNVIGDTLSESDETFFVNLSNPSNALILDGQGIGTITNDDGILLSANLPPARAFTELLVDTQLQELHVSTKSISDAKLQKDQVDQNRLKLLDETFSAVSSSRKAPKAIVESSLDAKSFDTEVVDEIWEEHVENFIDEDLLNLLSGWCKTQ